MKVMITGAAGFIGGFLAKHCLDSGCLVLGLGVSEPANWDGGSFEHCDVRDADRLSKLVTAFQPDRIFHLAAQSYPTVSLEQPRETLDINIGGTVNLFEAARTLPKLPMTVVACSSAEYGPVAAENLPVREEHPLRPLHPYGVSKVGQDLLAAQYFANYKIPCVRIRIFNTTGPGKLGDVCSDLARRAVEIELGLTASFPDGWQSDPSGDHRCSRFGSGVVAIRRLLRTGRCLQSRSEPDLLDSTNHRSHSKRS